MGADIIRRFESIGDSCEFGFVQRHFGLEPISLLRWAGSSLHGLVNGLEDNFRDIFSKENLRPAGPGLVIDTKYDLAFHCDLAFDAGGVSNDPANLAKFRRYFRDMRYRLGLFNEDLDGRSKLYVYKSSNGLPMRDLLRLKAALDLRGPQKLLCVVPASADRPAGQLERLACGLKIAGMARVAAPAAQDDIDVAGWLVICAKAVQSDWGHRNAAFTPGAAAPQDPARSGLAPGNRALVIADRTLAEALTVALYRTILLREPDMVGLANTIEATLRHGYTVEQLMLRFLASIEFAAKRDAILGRYCDRRWSRMLRHVFAPRNGAAEPPGPHDPAG